MVSSVAESLFWVAVAACALAQAAIVRSVATGRADAPTPDAEPFDAAHPPRPSPPTRPLREAAWALLPAVALVIVLIWTWRTMHPLPDAQSGAVHAPPAAPTSVATGTGISAS